jgi:hypothetical protein
LRRASAALCLEPVLRAASGQKLVCSGVNVQKVQAAIRHPYEAATSALHGDVDSVRLRALLRAEPPTEEKIAAQSEVAWVNTPEQLRRAVAFLMGCTVRGCSLTVVQERVALEQGAAARAPHPVATLAMQQKLISTHMHASGLQLGSSCCNKPVTPLGHPGCGS